MSDSKDDKIAVFESNTIRKAWHNNEWFFSIVDIVGTLSDSSNPTDYLKKIRKRDEGLKRYIGTNCPKVAMFPSSKTIDEFWDNLVENIRLVTQSTNENFEKTPIIK